MLEVTHKADDNKTENCLEISETVKISDKVEKSDKVERI